MNEVKQEQKPVEGGSSHGAGCTCAGCGKSSCSPMHWSCCIVPMLSTLFWVLGVLSLIVAWVAGDSQVWGKADAFWYLNAITLGVLAMGGRGKKWGACRKTAGCGSCCTGSVCKDGACK